MSERDAVMIRPVQREDAAAIARLWQALTDEHVALDPQLPGATPGAAERYAERLLERRDDPFTRTFVAETGGVVVGYVLGAILDLHPDLFDYVESGFIADIYVEPAYRRRGIARRLFETMTRWFAEQGVTQTEWQVSAVNLDGLRFWEAVGGKPIMVRMRLGPDQPGR